MSAPSSTPSAGRSIAPSAATKPELPVSLPVCRLLRRGAVSHEIAGMSEFMLDHVPAAFRDFLAPVGINKRCRTVGARDRQAILRPTVRASQARYILD